MIGPVFVGDLWVLAGQSNMQGVGNLTDVTPPPTASRPWAWTASGFGPRNRCTGSWILPTRSIPVTRMTAKLVPRPSTATEPRGSGLGLPFGVALANVTNVPVGLLVCAHGGTSMDQWDPAKKGDGGNSLYGSMLRQINLAGGKVRGVLWYQGRATRCNPPPPSLPRSSLNSLPRSAPIWVSPTCRSITSKSAGSLRASTRKVGTSSATPSG